VSEPLRIFAAGSLRPAFEQLTSASPGEPLTITYANALDLARRIAGGERADVFASASEEHPRLLHEAGLAHAPRAFATNRLVVAVPHASAARDVSVLAAPRTRLVVEVAGIPLGDYTRALLAHMDETAGAGFAQRALANVVFEEQLVDAVAARLLDGDADAAVLYATDVAPRAPRLRAIELPPGVQVAVTYVACATTSTPDSVRATAWIEALRTPPALTILRRAGFGPRPRAPERRRC
jgi:molybdate transport system substrate-binding protein